MGSSLTSIELSGLSRIELAFALLIVAAAGGLVGGLGMTERRRSLGIASALGASPHQLRRLQAGEPVFVILTGVFDPPPSNLAVPWSYFLVAMLCTIVTLREPLQLSVGARG